MKIELGANLIGVKDITKAKVWYTKVFGMKTVECRPPEFLEMTLGKNTFYIETKNPKRAKGFEEEFNIGGRSSAVIRVSNIKQFIAKCKKLNVTISVQPVQQFWGGWNAVIADPDGNEFIIDQDD
ncbi:VOC family protein [Candidatus Pacearchaeota archaeon]|nr:VOC family protein [Candidatus Pacearchaeota archaeon]